MAKHYPPPIPKSKFASCHPAKSIYAKGLCRSCYEKQLRLINPEFAERQRENCRQWAANHTDQKRAIDKLYRAKKDPDWHWAQKLRTNYHMTPRQYDLILQKNKMEFARFVVINQQKRDCQ